MGYNNQISDATKSSRTISNPEQYQEAAVDF